MNEAAILQEHKEKVKKPKQYERYTWGVRIGLLVGWYIFTLGNAYYVQHVRLQWWQLTWLLVTVALVLRFKRIVKVIVDMLVKEMAEKMLEELGVKAMTQARSASERAKDPPPVVQGYIALGTVAGDAEKPQNDNIRIVDGWLLISLKQMYRNMIILGKPGWGKTVTQKWLVSQLLKPSVPYMPIYFMEGKGDPGLAYDLVDMIATARGKPVPLFTMGYHAPCTVYDMFQGTPDAVFNRIAELVQLALMNESGDTAHYSAVHSLALRLACEAPCGAPTSLEDLCYRLSVSPGKDKRLQWLIDAWADDPENRQYAKEIEWDEVKGLVYKLREFTVAYKHMLGNGGFIFEHEAGVISSFKVSSAPFTAPRMARAMFTDIGDVLGNRLTTPSAYFVDELGLLKIYNLEVLFSQGRFFEAMVIVCSQTVAGLGSYKNQDAIVQTPGLYFQMYTDTPNDLLELGGYMKRSDTSMTHRGDGESSMTVRNFDDLIVKPSDVQRLTTGQGYLLYKNQAWLVQIPPPEVVPVVHDPNNIANRPKIPFIPPEKPKGGVNRAPN